MGAVQRLATVVMIGLVALSVILVLYLADESNRIDAREEAQKEIAIERGIETYLTYCMSCHGPAGEGLLTPGEQGTGRVGLPLGGETYATSLNQEGIDAQGTPVSGGVDAREDIIRSAILNGRGEIMPAWENELNDEQINELVIMIQNVDWNRVYNEAVEAAGGYPTAPAAAAPAAAAESSQPVQEEGDVAGGQEASGEAPGGEGAAAGEDTASGEEAADAVTITMGMPSELAFEPSEITIPANTDVTVNLPNEGAQPHNFSIDELDISVDAGSGEVPTTTINAAPGEYAFYCDIPGHKEGGMVGTLIVE